jgi:formamidopyrimidine-DNA glycosylase
MPELPEIETIKRGLAPHLAGVSLQGAIIRYPSLRWPIPADLDSKLANQQIIEVRRRGKYLLFLLSEGTLICHLGMSGSLRLVQAEKPLLPHDHVDILLSSGQLLRYNDPRRFGAILWTNTAFEEHPLLQSMGIEPLSVDFTGAYLKALSAKHKSPIKSFLMNSKIIAGIGNIYAAEALFLAAINPQTKTNQLSNRQCEELVAAIKSVLHKAIDAGGTTLKDYVNSEGKPGYFSQQLYVYGRAGLPCRQCSHVLQSIQLGQRSTVFCPHCQ